MPKVNYTTLLVFAPILLLTGITGMLGPSPFDLMSTAVPYNVLHIVFGVLGVGLVLSKRAPLIRSFNIGFGAIDLAQLAASVLHVWPAQHFQWHTGDDVLHLVVGAALVIIGLSGR